MNLPLFLIFVSFVKLLYDYLVCLSHSSHIYLSLSLLASQLVSHQLIFVYFFCIIGSQSQQKTCFYILGVTIDPAILDCVPLTVYDTTYDSFYIAFISQRLKSFPLNDDFIELSRPLLGDGYIQMGFDVDKLLQRVLKCQILEEAAIIILCSRLKDILIEEKNVERVGMPITVVGDVHGQFFDVLEVFKVGGQLPYTNYLFLGDYVDRGAHSVQTITLLCLLKLKYPKRIWMIRGNHELRAITQNYGFYMQCQNKYGSTVVWQQFTDLFDFFPVSAIAQGTLFAVHGGLSPLIESVQQIEALNRFQEIPHDGPICDMMWSDPEEGQTGFVISPRGAGYIFGEEVLKKFLHHNGFEHLTRAHQLCHEGYQLLFGQGLSTVWSAPNYVYRMGNMASIMQVDQHGERSFNLFSESPQNIARGIVAAAADTKLIKNETQKYFM